MASITSTPRSDEFGFEPDAIYEMQHPGMDYRFRGDDLYFDGDDLVAVRWEQKACNMHKCPDGKWRSFEGFWAFPICGTKITLVSDDGSDK